MIDCLIVGQGIAGTCLAVDLISHGLDCLVVDRGTMSCSHIAAGVMNPVTGRRFVKTWNVDELWEVSTAFYQQLETLFDCDDLCVPRVIWQVLSDAEKEEQWLVRTGDPDYADFLDPEVRTLSVGGLVEMRCGRIGNARQADLPFIVQRGRAYLEDQQAFREESFTFDALRVAADHVSYRDIKARYLVFCEGHRVARNPYFNWLPLNVTRGEMLVCEIPEVRTDAIIKGKVSLVPMEGDQYWVGSTYLRDPEHGAPSADGLQELQQGVAELVEGPFSVAHHLAAVRPTTRDRRPFVGRHPEHSTLFVLNGLGTKGASLAPYCALKLSALLRAQEPVPAELDILRYWQG
ncbi:MAG: FAD-binding oxidoreductase [Saprospiraceae bacterium]|nr:FAD-binding oxidoreductase [Saprospiraceae bacterium]